ncbi:MAG: hypothetical protein K8R74_08345 [Bacteroidales bacterium]|nr:hypothetical protein [Bacteroidales bacterium]
MKPFFIICFNVLFLLSSEIKSQTDSIVNIEKPNKFENTFLILDAHTHHGFPSLLENEIDLDMKYLKEIN